MKENRCNINVFGSDNEINVYCEPEEQERIHISIQGSGNYVTIEEDVRVAESLFIFIIDNNSVVHIGKGTTFEETSISVADDGNQVLIGQDCMFARGIRILASDFHSIISLESGKRTNISHGIIIQNHVWVGYNAVILKNSFIYANSIVSAGTILSGTVAANSVCTHRNGNYNLREKRREITWERARTMEGVPICSQDVKADDEINMVKEVADIIYCLENDIAENFNFIKGWVFWNNRNARETQCVLRFCDKRGEIVNKIIEVQLSEREDVCQMYNNESIGKCGFRLYMPAEVIHNQKDIDCVEIILQNNGDSGKRIIYKRD